MLPRRLKLGRVLVCASALMAASSAALAQQFAPAPAPSASQTSSGAAVRLPQPPPSAPPKPAAAQPSAVVTGYDQFAARAAQTSPPAPIYASPLTPAATPTAESVATPPAAPLGDSPPAVDPASESDPDFTLISKRQPPLPDPEQPGNLTKYLEETSDRLKRLEGAARSAPPKWPQVRMSGFMQADMGLFSQSLASKADLGNIQNGVGFRRTRLQAVGKLSDFTAFSIEMDFAIAGRPSFLDVWGEQQNLPFFGTIRIGQFRQPTTLDGWTSIRHLDFLERNAAFQAFDPFRRVGIMAYDTTEDERTEWAYSVYGTGLTFWNGVSTNYATLNDTRYGTQLGDHGGVSTAMRASHLVFYDEPSEGRYLLHVGAGYNFSRLGGNPNSVGTDASTYDSRPIPEFFVGDITGGGQTAAGTPSVIDSGRIRARTFNFWHTEIAGNYGSFHFQNEWMVTTLNQIGGPTIWMPGTYAQCGYFLTGESWAYNKQAGVMDYNVTPFSDFFGLGRGRGFGGWGAWEVVARWTYVDLTCHGATPILPVAQPTPPSPNFGVLNESTLGLNWWWNRYTRLQFNWIHSMPNYQNGTGYAPFDIFGSRFQVEF